VCVRCGARGEGRWTALERRRIAHCLCRWGGAAGWDPRHGTRIPWMAGRGVDGAPSMDGGPPNNGERRSAADGPAGRSTPRRRAQAGLHTVATISLLGDFIATAGAARPFHLGVATLLVLLGLGMGGVRGVRGRHRGGLEPRRPSSRRPRRRPRRRA
jgi:hypothetical protein